MSQTSQDSLPAPPKASQPATPVPEHATLPYETTAADTTGSTTMVSLTPPPSSQFSQTARPKSRTSTPVASHLSSPPPTAGSRRIAGDGAHSDTSIQIRDASSEELRALVGDLLSAVQDAKTTAAHYKLQYQMLSMESAETAERMAVEMDMAQREVEVLQTAEQHRQVQQQATPRQTDSDPNVRPVHVDLYNAMIHEIQDLRTQNTRLDNSNSHQKRVILQQESEIATLNDRVVLMRERIKESRDHLTKSRQPSGAIDRTPRTERGTPYQTPRRQHATAPDSQGQHGFAALLQATDLVSQASTSATPTSKYKKGHSRASHSMSSLPATPQREIAKPVIGAFYTPVNPRQRQRIPQTAPVARTLNFDLAAARPRDEQEQQSDGTVSASDDSEAETEVPEKDSDVGLSQASQLASQMLRSPTGKRDRDGVPKGFVQSKIFAQVRKPGVQRIEESPETKKARHRTNSVGLGIVNVRD